MVSDRLTIPTRMSSRLAARRARAAIKRTADDLEPAPAEGTTKRPRRRAAVDYGEDSNTEPESSQSIIASGHVEEVQGNETEDILSSMAGTAKEETVSAPNTEVTKTVFIRTPAPGEPLVWANGRGSLCEALPYFKAHKSSLYSVDKVAQGILIDYEVDPLDVFGEEVIITSMGGNRVKSKETGTMIRARDTADNAANFKSARNAYRNKTLVAVIAGDGHPFYPCTPPHPYAVLGYFHITDMWKEKQIPSGTKSPISTWRMRLEKADLTEPSWWVHSSQDAKISDPSVAQSIKAPVAICEKCKTPSKEIFNVGWFCLNHECKYYYRFAYGTVVALKGLAYTEVFLNERTPFEGEIPSIVPPIPDPTGLHGTELSLRRGFVCPDCGCCNRRVYWNRWVCENKDCQYARDAPMLPYPDALLEQENAKFEEKMRSRRLTYGVNENSLNQDGFEMDPFATVYQRGYLQFSQTLTLGGFKVRQYFLPDAQGRVLGSFSIFSASGKVNKRPNGSNDLFRTLEVTDIGLRRNPAAVVGHKLEGYTRHFQQNFGARYKFGVAVQSRGFSEAPDVILIALQRLIWARQMAVEASNAFIRQLDERFVGPHALVTDVNDFNELLALGYMEDDKINYHDDGEKELGPAVAALSLGSPSTMKFRPKRKTGFFLPTKKDRGRPGYKEVLEVTMKHGDMMVMVGTEIQKVYEHTVDPHGMRRFSLTARYIDPEKMESQEDRNEAITRGAIPPRAQAFVYDGQ
ncbi:hypothetical protein C8A03DRAFT_13524 [Achaetomium macrosporum]|uniref:Alpha-ketoglutarate-dependent dioxygenase AlkB-like domain-containing protein n=1 Tax=Achaetomium macrosporum TaxID=79813 RepID=A0AAN7HCT2_9PEZI|nr:hypothetical protein C8A03DRAFT_13524 [Achaetomium macrosporum]